MSPWVFVWMNRKCNCSSKSHEDGPPPHEDCGSVWPRPSSSGWESITSPRAPSTIPTKSGWIRTPYGPMAYDLSAISKG